MPFSTWGFIREQLGKPPLVVSADLTGKVVMVVGANTGIGFEACVHFAKMKPAKLIMTARTKEKGEDAVQRLAKRTNYQADYLLVELSQFSSVKSFVENFEKTENRLDILVLNAGKITASYTTTEDGWESTIQVNALASSLVALRLLPMLENTAKAYGSRPRLVQVASAIHYWADWSDELSASHSIFKDLNSKEYFLGITKKYVGAQYVNSKLLNVFWTRAFAEKIPANDAQVIVNCLDPGFCKSELGRDAGGSVTRFMDWLMRLVLGFTSEEGSRQIIYAAVGGETKGKKLQGAYVHMSEVEEPSEFVMSDRGRGIQKQIWAESIDILGKVDPRVLEIVQNHLV